MTSGLDAAGWSSLAIILLCILLLAVLTAGR